MSTQSAPIAAINVTPLVDVLLVLLIIFMITVPKLSDRVLLSLPQPRENPPPPTVPLRLQIAVDGAVALDGQPLSMPLFRAEIAHLASRREMPLIEVDADDQVAYEHVVSVLADLKNVGISRVGFRER
jgi:biopolymer transport protein ExbD